MDSKNKQEKADELIGEFFLMRNLQKNYYATLKSDAVSKRRTLNLALEQESKVDKMIVDYHKIK